MHPIHYAIVARQAAAHLFDITLRVDDPDPHGQAFCLPAWIPGSYMIREFARNVVTLGAHDAAGRAVAVRKTDKHRWLADPVDGALTLRYQVYAWDLSVRSAHLDQTVGFFNGTSVFLAVEGREAAPCVVDIQRPPGTGFANWRVATALPEAEGTARYDFGLYRAADYDELIDHPVTLGEFALATFAAHGVPHDVVISGPVPGLDMDRLTDDLRRICETQIAFFEPDSRRAPMTRYVFMTMAVSDGYGGLEHRASTALIAKRSDFPVRGAAADAPLSDGYRTYLGLCSHEYFHTWNVKRIKPDRFAPYDLADETYTELLWLFEGFTSYYDDLFLLRSGTIARTDYLRLLGKTIGGVLRGSGRRKQSVAESSFDAWVKYYRQDENASNAIVSYYTKGSLVALAFDLAIRAASDGQRSLDDVMRALWQRYGRDFYAGKPVGVAADAVLPLLCEVSGTDLSELFALAVHGTDDLPLERLLATVGVTLAPVAGKQPVSIGARVKAGADATLAAVFDDGAARHAGLSAGDVLVALDGLRVTGGNLDGLLARYRPGQMVVLHAFRRDVLRDFTVSLDGPDVIEYALAEQKTRREAQREAGGQDGGAGEDATDVAARRREAWLGGS
ncbi:MAG: M61 family metallopeptidase [Janthinobacterium lividum]